MLYKLAAIVLTFYSIAACVAE